MDEVKVGLDFGTHQTKVCVQITPDEGHGEAYYKFFKFKDLEGNESFFLPSTVQINNDDTLSYGYVDQDIRKEENMSRPILDTTYLNSSSDDLDIDKAAQYLYNKYSFDSDQKDHDIYILKTLLKKVVSKAAIIRTKKADLVRQNYLKQKAEYLRDANLFRYFKQATFSEREWNMKIPAKTLSIWYLTYVIFLLEDEYGSNFSINMGIPTDNVAYNNKKKLAVEILLTAYQLVEEVYKNDINKFLSEKIDNLIKITNDNYQSFSIEKKNEYIINIFPEAYAGLISLTSKGKLATGMSITADIGGGTTDVSFFTIMNNKPIIYRYWSIPYGLNYIAEASGFDYQEENLNEKANKEVIKEFNDKKLRIVYNLIKDLVKQFIKEETSVPLDNLYDALYDRIVVYNGGGSVYSFLTTGLASFTDVKIINSKLWKEENIEDKESAENYCQLLSTSYGLSLSDNDKDVKVEPFTSLFRSFPKKDNDVKKEIDKDMV